jgi:hypothetical protein
VGSGWQVNGITILRTGTPFSVTCGCDPRRVGQATSRASLVDGVPLRPPVVDVPGAQVNFAAFRVPTAGTYGTAGRNLLRGPAVINFDFSLFKTFKITETNSIEFRAEMFNIFNTPQFANPAANLAAPATFGRSLATTPGAVRGSGTNRQIQFALRYTF